MKFQALIDGVHFDPKKGAVKIVLIGSSHVSLDELTTLSPKDETVQVTLESEQTKLEAYPEEYAKRKEEEEIREQEQAAGGVAIKSGSREERELEEGSIPPSADDSITIDEEAGGDYRNVWCKRCWDIGTQYRPTIEKLSKAAETLYIEWREKCKRKEK